MERWYIIPRNKWFNIYLHKISRSDDDRALHDHRADNLSIVLRGSYTELLAPRLIRLYNVDKPLRLVRKRGAIVYRKAEQPHRLIINDGQPVWTLWFKFGDRRDWGFYVYDPRINLYVWTQWEEYERLYADDLWT